MKKLQVTTLLICLFAFTAINTNAQTQGAGYALDFDGSNDYVDISFIPSSNCGTVEGWFKNTGGGIIWSIGKSSDNNIHTWLSIRSSNEIGVYFANGVGNGFYYLTQSTISDEEWYHFSFVSDGSNKPKFYLNGINQILVDQGGFNNNHSLWWNDISNCNNHSLGVLRRNTAISYANISIDEVRIWNRALTQTEIRNNMNKQLTGNEPGLVTYYQMNEGENGTCEDGKDVCDKSGNGNHGEKK